MSSPEKFKILTVSQDSRYPQDLALTLRFDSGEAPDADEVICLVDGATDMLLALELVIEEMAPIYHDCTDDGLQECAWCVARSAIAKARGEK